MRKHFKGIIIVNLRNKIAIANFCTVIIPLTVIFTVVFIKFGSHSEKKERFSSTEVMYFFEENIPKLLSFDDFTKAEKDYNPSPAELLTDELESTGFHFKILKKNKEVFNNLTEKEAGQFFEFQGNFLNKNQNEDAVFFIKSAGKTLIYKKTSLREESDNIPAEVLAVYDSSRVAKKEEKSVLPIAFFNYGTLVLIVFSVAAFVIFVSFLSNYWIQKSLLETKEKITCGKFTIYLNSMQVFIGTKEIELKRQEFDLLAFLAIHRGEIFSKEDLLENVWGMDSSANEPTVTVHINRLRKKIEQKPENPRHLKTVWGKGYVFIP